jgi:hypothetical protein
MGGLVSLHGAKRTSGVTIHLVLLPSHQRTHQDINTQAGFHVTLKTHAAPRGPRKIFSERLPTCAPAYAVNAHFILAKITQLSWWESCLSNSIHLGLTRIVVVKRPNLGIYTYVSVSKMCDSCVTKAQSKKRAFRHWTRKYIIMHTMGIYV